MITVSRAIIHQATTGNHRQAHNGNFMRVVYKYGTGHEIPEGAKYLWSCVEDMGSMGRFVWHYYEIETEK